MRGMVPPDKESNVSRPHFAVVYVPRRNRKRFSANCVKVQDSKEAALSTADPEKKYYAAVVLGPSKSSEGQFIYYLLEWL